MNDIIIKNKHNILIKLILLVLLVLPVYLTSEFFLSRIFYLYIVYVLYFALNIVFLLTFRNSLKKLLNLFDILILIANFYFILHIFLIMLDSPGDAGLGFILGIFPVSMIFYGIISLIIDNLLVKIN